MKCHEQNFVQLFLNKSIHYHKFATTMANYSIEQLSNITGFSKLLIRTWENRYKLFVPQRTPTNIRFYDDETLVKALNVSILKDKGYKISKIASLTNKDIEDLVRNVTLNDEVYHLKQLNKVIESALTFNKALFHEVINASLDSYDTLYVYKNILLPALNRIGYLWLTNDILPSQEHFLSELIKQKLYSRIDSVMDDDVQGKEVWLLFLPEGEHHEIGLLVASLILTENNKSVIYLGQSVPLKSLDILKDYFTINKILFFAIAQSSVSRLEKVVSYLDETFSGSEIIPVTRNKDISLKGFKNVKIISTIDEFHSILN
ncbi:MAG: MerR family transcriptional regulator [Flavobacteriales bacterium]|nr:MerR family transcriptional regulator [Flavobacteriales bacterium]